MTDRTRGRAPDDETNELTEMTQELDVRAGELLEGGIGLARLAVGSMWRTARWSTSTSVHVAERVVGALASGESLTVAANEAAQGARDALLELAGIGDPAAHGDAAEARARSRMDRGEPLTTEELRRRGRELLQRSADVAYEEEAHPAYGRILEAMSPDEARILRLLADGPQPSVDVRSSSPVPNNSHLVAPGLTMIGDLAGCRYLDRVPSYLNNLYRLGLVWFSREPLSDQAYQVLEAQPSVQDAVGSVKRGRTVRRSILLTPFGADFVRLCLDIDPTV